MSDTLVPIRSWIMPLWAAGVGTNCRERAGRAADLDLSHLGITVKRTPAFNRAFGKNPPTLLEAGSITAFELGRAAEGIEVWRFFERHTFSTLGIKHIRDAIEVHYHPDSKRRLTEEASIDNRCFCRDPEGTLHAISISRLAPRTWCAGMPERYDPERLGGVWKKGTVALGFGVYEYAHA